MGNVRIVRLVWVLMGLEMELWMLGPSPDVLPVGLLPPLGRCWVLAVRFVVFLCATYSMVRGMKSRGTPGT